MFHYHFYSTTCHSIFSPNEANCIPATVGIIIHDGEIAHICDIFLCWLTQQEVVGFQSLVRTRSRPTITSTITSTSTAAATISHRGTKVATYCTGLEFSLSLLLVSSSSQDSIFFSFCIRYTQSCRSRGKQNNRMS